MENLDEKIYNLIKQKIIMGAPTFYGVKDNPLGGDDIFEFILSNKLIIETDVKGYTTVDFWFKLPTNVRDLLFDRIQITVDNPYRSQELNKHLIKKLEAIQEKYKGIKIYNKKK